MRKSRYTEEQITAGDHGLNRLLQPLAATFGFGLPQPDAVRTTLVGGAAQICRLRIRAMHSHFQGHPHVCYLVGCWPRAALLSARPGALTPRNLAILARSTHPGEVAEWSNAPDSKSGMRFSASRVRIPPSPPIGLTNQQVTLDLGISPTKRPKKTKPPSTSGWLCFARSLPESSCCQFTRPRFVAAAVFAPSGAFW